MYWIAYKPIKGKREYISGRDEHGNPTYSMNENDAYKFKHFETAMAYYNLGHAIVKKYE